MITLTKALSQSFAPADLPAAVRAALGKPLRRAAPLTQLALVGALASFLPGLQSAMHLPLDCEGIANWSLLLSLAIIWLNEGRCAQVLCAQLDHTADNASSHWLALSNPPLENSPASLQLVNSAPCNPLPDTPDFPTKLTEWLASSDAQAISLHSPVAMSQTVEFARL